MKELFALKREIERESDGQRTISSSFGIYYSQRYRTLLPTGEEGTSTDFYEMTLANVQSRESAYTLGQALGWYSRIATELYPQLNNGKPQINFRFPTDANTEFHLGNVTVNRLVELNPEEQKQFNEGLEGMLNPKLHSVPDDSKPTLDEELYDRCS